MKRTSEQYLTQEQEEEKKQSSLNEDSSIKGQMADKRPRHDTA